MNLFDRFFGKRAALKLKIPKGLELIREESKIRFKGDADIILVLSKELEKISSLDDGEYANFLSFKFFVSSKHVIDFNADKLYLPADAWKIMSAKFREVASSWQESPFDFNDCGYIKPKLELDIRVELVGEPYPR